MHRPSSNRSVWVKTKTLRPAGQTIPLKAKTKREAKTLGTPEEKHEQGTPGTNTTVSQSQEGVHTHKDTWRHR